MGLSNRHKKPYKTQSGTKRYPVTVLLDVEVYVKIDRLKIEGSKSLGAKVRFLVGEALALEELHDDEGPPPKVLTEIRDGHDVAVLQRARQPRLGVELLPRVHVLGHLRVDDLQGEDLSQVRVLYLEHRFSQDTAVELF